MNHDFRLVLVSDPHLSRTHPLFFYNWDVFCRWIDLEKPDLVVSLGDVSLNGIESEGDLEFARSQFDRLPCPWSTVPGNNDIGDNPPLVHGEGVIDSSKVDRYNRHFGSDYWFIEIGDWVLIGLNSFSAASGLKCGAEQSHFLVETLVKAGDRPVGLFMHQPLYLTNPNAQDYHMGCLYPAARAILENSFEKKSPRIVASGHNHEYWRHSIDGRDNIWCPSTAFVTLNEPCRGCGKKVPGFLDIHFTGLEYRIDFIRPAEFISVDIGTWWSDGADHYSRFCRESFPAPK